MVKKNEEFNPVIFLMPLGAGGLAIAFWAFLMFTIPHGKGLINTSKVHEYAQTLTQKILYTSVEALIIIFSIIHILTLIYVLSKYFKWKKTPQYKTYLNNPLINNGLMTLFLAVDMTFNIAFSVGNHFFLQNGPLFQTVMLPALIGWGVLYIFTIYTSINILKIAFTKEFDVNKMHFGFLTHPFALAMLAVTGFGISAFSQSLIISSIAFFLSLMPWLTAILLTSVKFISMFQNHFKNNLPERKFIPSTFIIMPIIMLLFLSVFRMGHYFDHHFNAGIPEIFYIIVTLIPFAFLTWYSIFALSLTSTYYKEFRNYDISQWGFICPFAAYVVIGHFVNNFWLNSNIVFAIILLAIGITGAGLYFNLLRKQLTVIRS